MLKRRLALALIAALIPAAAAAAPITELFVFGDSLSDQGNALILTGGAFPPAPYAGRASNGPVAVERLAELLLGLGFGVARRVRAAGVRPRAGSSTF